MRSKALWIFFISIIIASLCLIAFAFVVNVDAAEADPACWHGCPPVRTAQVWMPVVQQCSGPYCGLFTAEPEPVR